MTTRPDDEFFMRLALKEAEKAANKGEVPVGAVIIRGGQTMSRAYNRTVASHDPTAHAEIRAIRKACLRSENYRLPDCDLYVTLEPCPMCVGSIVQTRIRRLVYGASDPKGGGVVSILKFPFAKTNHQPGIKGGILAGECGKILQEFFRNRR